MSDKLDDLCYCLYFTALNSYNVEKAINNGFFHKEKLDLPIDSAKNYIFYSVSPRHTVLAVQKNVPIIAFYEKLNSKKSCDWGLEIENKRYYHSEAFSLDIINKPYYPEIGARYAVYLVEEEKVPGDPIIIVFDPKELTFHKYSDFRSITPSTVKIEYILRVENIRYFDENNYEVKLKDITKELLK